MSSVQNQNGGARKEESFSTNVIRNNSNRSEYIEDKSLAHLKTSLNCGLDAPNFKVKPEHWTDAYWETITSHYKWFMHVDGNAGCSICYANRSFAGKKSVMATFKLRIMNLSYDEFEKKLIEHNKSTHHEKSLLVYKEKTGQSFDSIDATLMDDNTKQSHVSLHLKSTAPLFYFCPLCNKEYKFKKSLAKHIFYCNRERSSKGFYSPCGCVDYLLYSIGDMDEHNLNVHEGKYQFKCKSCAESHETATTFYGHLLMDHDYQWNPYKEMKMLILALKEENDSEFPTELISEQNLVSALPPSKRKKLDDPDYVPDNFRDKVNGQDKKITSSLKLALDQIHTCKYCGGRYLSLNILNEHLHSRHSTIIEIVKDEDVAFKFNLDKGPQTDVESSKFYSQSSVKRNRISKLVKEQLVKAYDSGQDWLLMSDELGINKQTAYTIIRKWRATNKLSVGRVGGYKKCKITPEIGTDLVLYVENHNFATLKQMQKFLHEKYDIVASFDTISKFLNGKYLTPKRIRDLPEEINSLETKEKRFEFVETMKKIGSCIENCYYIDEAIFNIWIKRSYKMSMDVERFYRSNHGQRGGNLHLCMAISNSGVMHHKVIVGGFDSVRFQEFIDEMCAIIANKEQRLLLVNNRRSKNGVSMGTSHHQVVFMPPCSAFLNPIESVFDEIRVAVKIRLGPEMPDKALSYPDRRQTLMDCVNYVVGGMYERNFEEYYKRCHTSYSRCSQRLDFMGN